MKSHQRVTMTHWWLAAGVERQGGEENPPTSHKDLLVVGGYDTGENPPMSHKDLLVVDVAARRVLVVAGRWLQ